MVPNFVQHRFSDLLGQLLLGIADALDVFLKNIDHVRQHARLFDASLCKRPPLVKPQQQSIVPESHALALMRRRTISHLNGYLFQIRRKTRGERFERLLEQFIEARFAHVVWHR
jgi:hypothetical protein